MIIVHHLVPEQVSEGKPRKISAWQTSPCRSHVDQLVLTKVQRSWTSLDNSAALESFSDTMNVTT